MHKASLDSGESSPSWSVPEPGPDHTPLSLRRLRVNCSPPQALTTNALARYRIQQLFSQARLSTL